MIYITCKNYFTGLSKKIHAENQQEFSRSGVKWWAKGPLGFGTPLLVNAPNVAFIGGTGILSILDTIARFACYVCGVKEATGQSFGKYFQLRLYYAIRSDEDALALPFLKKLHEIHEDQNSKRFELIVRYGTPSNTAGSKSPGIPSKGNPIWNWNFID